MFLTSVKMQDGKEKGNANLQGRQILMGCCMQRHQMMTMDGQDGRTPIHRHYILHHVAKLAALCEALMLAIYGER